MKPLAAVVSALVLLPSAVPSQSSGRASVNGCAEFRHGNTRRELDTNYARR
jgi:hypothetical protein